MMKVQVSISAFRSDQAVAQQRSLDYSARHDMSLARIFADMNAVKTSGADAVAK